MKTISISCAAALAAAIVAPAWAGPLATQPSAAQPPTTSHAGKDALVIPALAPPKAKTEPAADSAPVVDRPQPQAGSGESARAAELLRKLLAGPPDAPALNELIELRDRQLQRDADAMDDLARGLRLYLEVGPRLAAGPLDKATGNPNVFSLTTGLPTPLEKIAAQCRAAASARETARPCPRCGDTRLAPCKASRCNGSGYVPCPKCSGAGVLRGTEGDEAGKVLGLCGQCDGAGVIACQTCGGRGVVECTACKPKPSQAAASMLPAAESLAILQAVCKARWIRAGGIDLYTNGARQPSPK